VVLSLFLGFLAPFAYELGVMLPLAIFAVEVLAYARREFDRFSWVPFLYMLLIWVVALPLVVLLEPETGASLQVPSLQNLWQNGVYFAQGLIFPIAPLGTLVSRSLPADEYVLLAVVNLLGFVALWAFYRWVKRLDLFWYALSWFVVGVAPLWLMLDFSYVITSPRILYLGAVGSAILWGGVPVFLWAKAPARWWTRTLAMGSLLAMLTFNVVYVRDKMALADTVATPIWQAVDSTKAQGPSARLLYLNVPAWIAPKKPTYLIGTEGLTFIPEYVRVQDSMFVNAGVEPEIRAFMFDPVKQESSAYIGYAGPGLDWAGLEEEIRQADAVYVTVYTPDELRFAEAGALVEPSMDDANAPDALARFGDQLLLSDLQTELSDSELVLTLWWHVLQVPQGDVTVFVHVYDGSGQLVAQKDGYPLAGLFPSWGWEAGDLMRDVRIVALPDDLEAGTYSVSIGWYDAASGQRLPAVDREGRRAEQDAVPVFQFAYP
jgi:hypothetical protein